MNNYTVSEVSEQNLTQIVDFISEHEISCIYLMSFFVSQKKIILPPKKNFWAVYEQNQLCAVFMTDEHGLILHCIPNPNEELIPIIQEKTAAIKPFCIMGSFAGTQLIAKSIGKKSKSNIKYELYAFKNNKSINVPQGFCEKRCSVNDVQMLFPLQKNFEIEEVLCEGDIFYEKSCVNNLKTNLTNQIIYAVFPKNEKNPVAKAGTNAQGLNWNQIGGVYTLPQYRGKGLAAFLVNFLANQFAEQEKNCALFVKETNLGAKRAYEKAGFAACKDFAIIYY